MRVRMLVWSPQPRPPDYAREVRVLWVEHGLASIASIDAGAPTSWESGELANIGKAVSALRQETNQFGNVVYTVIESWHLGQGHPDFAYRDYMRCRFPREYESGPIQIPKRRSFSYCYWKAAFHHNSEREQVIHMDVLLERIISPSWIVVGLRLLDGDLRGRRNPKG